MLKRKSFKLILVGLALFMSTAVCSLESTGIFETGGDRRRATQFKKQDETATAQAATQTAQALITPTATPTITPTATPTPSPPPELIILPPPIFTWEGPPALPLNCATGDIVEDPAVHILGIEFYDPSTLDSNWDGWITRIEFGTPVNTTLANDYSFVVKAKIQVVGESIHDGRLIEGLAGKTRMGVCTNPDCEDILPGTEGLIYPDDQGYLWTLLPSGARQITYELFHVEEEGQPIICFNIAWFTFDLYLR